MSLAIGIDTMRTRTPTLAEGIESFGFLSSEWSNYLRNLKALDNVAVLSLPVAVGVWLAFGRGFVCQFPE